MQISSSISPSYRCSFSPLALAISSIFSLAIHAEEPIEVVKVSGHQQNNASQLGSVDELLKQQGVDFSAAGGMSNLPVLNGMMGDRVKVLIDGADITASCANHMNPPLSYVSANQVQVLNVVAGISPVSAGGDNIAGVISVNEIAPLYIDGSDIRWHSGYASAQYRSNNQANSIGFGARMANQYFSLDYQGAYEDAESYEDGHGDKVLDSLYRAQNHALTAAIKDDKQQLAIKLTHQNIPFQGFPNQYMDMTDNKSYGITSLYQRQLDDGKFEAQVNWHGVKHEMGFFSDEKTGMMPMKTDADDYSYRLNWQFITSKNNTVNVGHEYFNYQLDDWWPAIEDSLMMGPNDYLNINGGERQRMAVFAETTQLLSSSWWLSAGIRLEHVSTNTGEVQAYTEDSSMSMDMSSMSMSMDSDMSISTLNNNDAADIFNAMSRKRSDTLLDATLSARYLIDANQQIEFGFARKNRAPNLYERYSWGVSTMATTMIGWFGDGNGYIGNPNLAPETAHTLSATYIDSGINNDWQLSANLWYTSVKDYIDAQAIDSFNNTSVDIGTRNILQFTNVDATLYGVKLAGSLQLSDSETWGQWQLNADISSTRGKRDNNNGDLYQIVPLKSAVSIEQQSGAWQNSIEWQWVASKKDVDDRRLENTTKSYHLVNFHSKLDWQNITLSFAIDNVLDAYYELPMGGVSIAEYKMDNSQGFNQLAGAGRSVNIGVSYAF
ncbi:TonB-dependent receptor [uncultured Paraglaciecola sp.]|uniref:TonB-dependent receptor n=1 Tax=uncultured Paraglaciecola sp. TaxID=1765024 RepID=UPI0030D969CD